MPKLFEITDAYTPEETIDGLPVEPVLPTERPRVIINTAEFDKPKPDPLWDDVEGFKNKVKSGVSGIGDAIKYASELDQKFTSSIVNFPKKAYENSDDLIKGIKNLFGLGEEERYQLWPEKVVKEALTSAGDIAKPNPYPEGSEQWQFYEDKRQEGMVPAAMAISALAGSGGLAGTGAKAGEVALGATPFLRPALRHKDRLYKGKLGQEHQDIIPKELYEDFSRKAMSGEDLAEYNFGFINDKGHFLDREKALKYGIDTGIIDPHSGRFGALTTTLMADSSKPGMAIEAAAKTRTLIPAMKIGDKIYKGKPGDEHIDIINKNRLGLDDFEEGLGDNRFGFINHKGQFLNREKAMEYAKNNDLVKSRSKLLTSAMLLADSSKPGTAIEAMAKANPFYSAVEHTVKNISQDKMTGDQWLGTLSNKPGVKPEELDWTGLRSFLEENKGKPVTKQQIEDHIAANKVELKEVSKGGDATPEQAFALAKEHGWQSWDAIDPATQAKYLARVSKEAGDNPTKYHKYQLPGGENYREMLLTLPKTEQGLIAKPEGASGAWNVYDKSGNKIAENLNPSMSEKEAISFSTRHNNDQYKSSHWDEPNILAHVRMNDRTIDGKKSLHLEEIQSDWHQQGRDKGYKQDNKNKLSVKNEGGIRRVRDEKGERVDLDGSVGFGTEELARAAIARNTRDIGGVPDAPFKKSWHELALKRMIREASEKGYDRLSWTPGEAQAARYDLSKDVSKVYLNNPVWHGENDIRGNLIVTGKNGNDLISKPVKSISEIKELIGKEAADNLVNKPSSMQGRDHVLSGEGLKVGGEGMKGFYDQIIPKSVNKIAKEYGVKVEKGKTSEGHDIFYIDLPEGLKNTALRKGFPLFSNVHPGYSFIPYAGNPFENKQ